MKIGLSGLGVVPLTILFWGISSEVRAEFLRPTLREPIERFSKFEGIEEKQTLESDDAQARVKPTRDIKQVKPDVLLSVEGTITEGNEQLDDGSLYDLHVFEGQAGQIVRITLNSEEFDTFLLLKDSSGLELAYNDDGNQGTNAEIVFRLPTMGEYRILASAYNTIGRGTYKLTVATANEQALRQSELTVEADNLFQQGVEAYQVNQYRTALEAWQTALKIYQKIGKRQGEANSLGNIGIAYDDLAEYQQAINFQQQSLKIKRELGDRHGETDTLNSLGSVHFNLSEYQRAIDFHQQSLELAKEINYLQGQANALGNLGRIYDILGEYQQAISFHQQSLMIKEEIEDRDGEANSLINLGLTYFSLGEYQEAVDFHQKALEIGQEIGDHSIQANALGNLGTAYDSLGEYQKAIDFYQQSLTILYELSDRRGEALLLGNLGIAYDSLGEYQKAINFQQQSLAIKQEIGDRQGEALSLGNLGIVYRHLGEYQQALKLYQQASIIHGDIGSRRGEADALSNIGLAYFSLGEYRQASDIYQQALVIKKEISDRQGEANVLGNLGLVYAGRNDYQQAIYFYQQSLDIVREIGDSQGEAALMNYLGNSYNDLGEYQKAIDLYQQALKIGRRISDRAGEASSLTNLGIGYLNQAETKTAEEFLFESIKIQESLRSAELPDENRISFFETQTDTYQALELALILQGKFETALEVAERGRTRSLVQVLSERLPLKPEDLDLTKSPSFSEIQRIAKEQKSTLVEYSISRNSSGEGSSLYIWVVQPTGELHFKEVAIGESLAAILELVEQSRVAMAVRGRGGLEPLETMPEERDATAQLNQLHQLLIEPITDLLPDDPTQRVVFIPQGDLFLVPFPALIDESGTYLIERHTVLTAPSIQTLDLTRRRSTITANRSGDTANILTVGNPVMPEVWNPDSDTFTQLSSLVGAEQEAKAIASFFGTEALIGAEATEQAVKQQIENARIVHLATHGLLEYGIPEESGVRDVPGAIALTPSQDEDGLLTATEIIEELNLQADLVVLSACDTGLGRVTGDGVIGLSRSLIAAGTPSVIVSLWSIPDAPTAELMVEFYRQRQQGKDKAQALRQAMLTTMETHPNPRDWAAFTLIGEAN